MKKSFLSISIFSLLLSLGSCNNLPKTNVDAALQQEMAEEKPLTFDTLTIEKEGPENMNVHYKYVIDYPVEGPDTLVDLIQKTIFNSLGDSTTTQDFTTDKLEALGDSFITHSVKEIKKYYGGENEERTVGYGNEGQVKITDNTEKYLTYLFDSYLYTGGAHGMPTRFYFTFDKVHNKVLQWNDIIAEQQRDALHEMIKKELNVQYYKEHSRSWEEDFFEFKLPKQTPALTQKGVVFMYEAYEIDCYAAGTPFCVIPYENIKNLMTPHAQELIP